MIPQQRSQHLRAGLLVSAGDRVWVVDRVHPVALVLDAATAAQVALVGWPQVPAGSSPERVVLASEDGLWVQQHRGPVVHSSPDGELAGRYVSDTVLGAVSAHGAWCAPRPRAQDVAATPDAPPADHRTSAQLYLARRDQVTRTVHVDAPVRSLRGVDDDLYVEVETGTWSRRPLGTPTTWELGTGTAWLRLRADQDVPERLSTTSHGCGGPPPGQAPRRAYHRLPDLRDLALGKHGRIPEPHARTAGLDWFVGSDRSLATRPEPVLAVALEAGTTRERWRLPLGTGVVAALTATAEHVWVAVEQPPNGAYRPSSPTGVVRVDAATGEVETLVGPDDLDITALSWPIGPPPVDDDDYTTFWQHRLAGLDACWTDTSGRVSPLSDGLSSTGVDVVGVWPDTTLHVTFDWARRPGVRLRRIIALYDDLGRPEEPLHADVHLMEDLDTGHVPAAPAPGSDHLDL